MSESLLTSSSLLKLHFEFLIECWERKRKHIMLFLFYVQYNYPFLEERKKEFNVSLLRLQSIKTKQWIRIDCSRWDEHKLTLCERGRGEDEPSHRVGGRGRRWWGQDAAVGGRRPGQGAAGPPVCNGTKAHYYIIVCLCVCLCVWQRQTLFRR